MNRLFFLYAFVLLAAVHADAPGSPGDDSSTSDSSTSEPAHPNALVRSSSSKVVSQPPNNQVLTRHEDAVTAHEMVTFELGGAFPQKVDKTHWQAKKLKVDMSKPHLDDGSTDGSTDGSSDSSSVASDDSAGLPDATSELALLQASVQEFLGEDRKLKVHTLHPESTMASRLLAHGDHHTHSAENPADLMHFDASVLDSSNDHDVVSFYDEAEHVRKALWDHAVPVLTENNHMFPHEVASVLGMDTFPLHDFGVSLIQLGRDPETGIRTWTVTPLDHKSGEHKHVMLPTGNLVMQAMKEHVTGQKSAGADDIKLEIEELRVTFPSSYKLFSKMKEDTDTKGRDPADQGALTDIRFSIIATPIGEVVIKTEGQVSTGPGRRDSRSGMYYDNPPPEGKAEAPYNTIGYYTESAEVQFESLDEEPMQAHQRSPGNSEQTWAVSLKDTRTWSAELGAGVGVTAVGPYAKAEAKFGYSHTTGTDVSQVISDMDCSLRSSQGTTKWTYSLRHLMDFKETNSVASTNKPYTSWIDVVNPRQYSWPGYVNTWKPQYAIPPQARNAFEPFSVAKYEAGARMKREIKKGRYCTPFNVNVMHNLRAVSSMYGLPALFGQAGEWGYYISKRYTNNVGASFQVCFGIKGVSYEKVTATTKKETSRPQTADTDRKTGVKAELQDRRLMSPRENLAKRWGTRSGTEQKASEAVEQ